MSTNVPGLTGTQTARWNFLVGKVHRKERFTDAEESEWRALCKLNSAEIQRLCTPSVTAAKVAAVAPVVPTIPTKQRIIYQGGVPVVVEVPDLEAMYQATLAKLHTARPPEPVPAPGSALEYSRHHYVGHIRS